MPLPDGYYKAAGLRKLEDDYQRRDPVGYRPGGGASYKAGQYAFSGERPEYGRKRQGY